eukprot:358018-Chlamydomonas_euryale.AAC.3
MRPTAGFGLDALPSAALCPAVVKAPPPPPAPFPYPPPPLIDGFVPVNGIGLLVAENLTSVVQVEFPVGSYMAGASISRTGPGVPAKAFISTSAPTPNNTHATWIMACCHGQDIKMVELQVTMQPDGAYVLATGAGYYRTACNLNADIVNSAWVAKNSMA